ncbi:MAG: ABC transporter ATP-binding protein [Halanaerobiaceae bacterium]
MADNLLNLKNLEIGFTNEDGIVHAVNGASLQIDSGQSIGIVGESGCGKSVTAFSILQLLPPSGNITNGEIKYRKANGEVIDLANLDPESKEMRKIRGAEISMVFQEPLSAFSPVHTVGNQISESIILHQDIRKKEAREKTIDLLNKVGISNPSQRVDDYPFQMSGGMRQRAMIAMALACNPRLLIADEPTTALDVTIQAQVLHLIKDLQEQMDLSMMLITHDLGVVAHMVDYVYVMYLGQVVEYGAVEKIYDDAKHPYTRDLMKSIPKASGTEGKLAYIKGSVPNATNIPSGCPYHTRCNDKIGKICEEVVPDLIEVDKGCGVRCLLYNQKDGEVNV